ncbi:MAG: hypothetical protein QW168_05245 [Sulfolobales archaeon]
MRLGLDQRFRRGVGGVVGAALAVAIITAIALYAYTNMLKPPTVSPDPVLRVLDEYLSNKVVIGPMVGGYYVLNTGSSTVVIEYLVLRDVRTESITLSKVGIDSACFTTKTTMQPGEMSTLNCRDGLILVGVVSSDGKIFVRDPKLTVPYLIPRAVPQKVLFTPEVVSSVEQYIESINLLRMNTSTALVKLEACSMSNVRVSIKANVSLVIALRSPADPSAWNILVVGYGAYGRRSNSWLTVGSTCDLNLSSAGSLRFRIKIENLSIASGDKVEVSGLPLASPGIYPCLVNTGKQCWAEVSGTAGRVSVYVASSTSPSANVDLDPYYITGDLDENGYPEFFFVTQDFTTGSSSQVNDVITTSTRTTVAAVDSTTRPIRLILTDTPVNNTKYATAVISMRFVFWDNSADDITDNDNRIVLVVGLYDPEKSSYVYSVSLSYFELCRYRTVKPMTFSYIVKDFLLYIPSPAEIGYKNLYIAIDVFDPYSREESRNDADIILSIEYLGLVLGVRI